MIQEIRVTSKQEDNRGKALLKEIKRTLGILSIKEIRTAKVYRLQGLDQQTTQYIVSHILNDPIDHVSVVNKPFTFKAATVIEVGNKPGVMNPEVASLTKAVNALGIDSLEAADTSWEYYFSGDVTEEELSLICDRLLVNKTVAHVIRTSPSNLVICGNTPETVTIPLRAMSLNEFTDYSKQQQLYLNEQECKAIQSHFHSLGRDPYDAELETIAQTWSEHCSHKTFRAPLIIDGKEKEPLYTRLKRTAAQYNTNTISAFEDNAGVFRFYEGYGIAAKVETHNSPSAIEPYGGDATVSGGVFRDIMGTGP